LISLTSTLSGFGLEMQATANVSASDPAMVDAYWRMVEELVFHKQKPSGRPEKADSRLGHVGKQSPVSRSR
jgi:hypothetical protein